MSNNSKQRRATQRRKQEQRERRHVAALRRQATQYEGVNGRNVNRMSKEALERTVRHGKRYHIPGIGLGQSLATAAMLAMLEQKR